MDVIVGLMAGPLGVVFLFWCVLMFFAPFFWYGTSKRAREISINLDKLVKMMEEDRQAKPENDPDFEGQY